MLKTQTAHHHSSYPTVTQSLRPFWDKPFLSGNNNGSAASSFPVNSGKKNAGKIGAGNISTSRREAAKSIVKTAYGTATETATRVTVTVSVTPKVFGGLKETLSHGSDDLVDVLGGGVFLELVAAELDPVNGDEKKPLKHFAKLASLLKDKYEADFEIPKDFGEIGAIMIENEHQNEMFIDHIVLGGSDHRLSDVDPITFSCKSWIAPKAKRIFFTTKSYLPSKTPSGLEKYRKEELVAVRGDGTGERKFNDRIYDYDVYNDLGNPDDPATARPVLGANESLPYPRRCRTGRPKTSKDPLSEIRTGNVYVPRDEAFSSQKNTLFNVNTVYSVLHSVAPCIEGAIQNRDKGFPYFTQIDSLFNEGIHLPGIHESIADIVPNLVKAAIDTGNHILLFDTPEFVDRDKFGWMRDTEFSRQTLAGLNPCAIELVKEWPLKSALDPNVYGPAESAFTKEFVEEQIKGFLTLDEALKQKKLFKIDYHDILLPYVERVRSQDGTTLYGSRALFFLTLDTTLMPIGIELTRPPMDGNPQWKKAYRPCWTPTGTWLWKLAKAHLLAHDSGIHQLVSHWLRTHCCTEPYIIATHRQLSEMHPVYRFLHPHFRYTMEINALARDKLINADGVIEKVFTPLKYSVEISAFAYGKLWRFDHQSLPGDLISRGMAEPDPTAPHGLKLAIEDYPFANDGLVLWDVLKEWVSDYVTHFYPDEKSIQSDEEIQAWWTEIRTLGHADKKDEPWWPVLNTQEDLIGILTTMAWVTSGHHAAVNFGQYDYAGYFPNRPTIARKSMPDEHPIDEERMEQFKRRPEIDLLSTYPSQTQATLCMAVLHVLSSHSPDEEYIGKDKESSWEKDPVINAAFEKFSGRLKELEGIIDERNANVELKNRNGAGVVPYQLLKPTSDKPGATGRGVPYSISI